MMQFMLYKYLCSNDCHDSCSFCYKYNVARNDNIYKFMLSSIISSCGNSFLFLFSEIMHYEVSEISKELSKKKEKLRKKKEKSQNTPTQYSLNGMVVSKKV
jgi:hypothetical protein